jgi:TM2 domain-containing membrane protein YozV
MSTNPAGPGEAVPTLPPPAATPAPLAPKLPKNPWLALVLSLFPGLGQVYNGQPAKAFVFFSAWVGSIYGASEISPFPFAFMIPFVYFYNLIDAYRGAVAVNARALGGLPTPEGDDLESPYWGGGLLVLGLLLLLNNLGWLHLAALARYWPVALIVAGAAFLYGSVQRRREPPVRRTPEASSETRDGGSL